MKKTQNPESGYRWLNIEEDIFEEEEVDALHIMIRGFNIVIHKR